MTPSELTLRGLLRVVGAGLLLAAVVYLVGASFVTGTSLVVDGGRLLR